MDQELEDDLTQTSHKFRSAIQKFIKNKKKAKLTYPNKKTYDFAPHELVMGKEYTPSSPLNHTYIGPYRIMELFPQGALLKDPRTGEQMSVHFANRGVSRGDAQDARASPLPPLCIPPGHVHPPPPKPERLAMRKDEAVGNKKKNASLFT
jgi:hypothetical protein